MAPRATDGAGSFIIIMIITGFYEAAELPPSPRDIALSDHVDSATCNGPLFLNIELVNDR